MKENLLIFLENRKKEIFYGFLCLLLLGSFAIRSASKKNGNPKEYAAVHSLYRQWKQTGAEDTLENLQGLLKKRPKLASKYEASIAQKLLVDNQGENAGPILSRLAKRNAKNLPLYYQFTEITKLILEEKFDEALRLSLSLREVADPNSYLYGLNLIRIASLYKSIGNHDEEIEAREQVRAFLSDVDDPKGVKHSLCEHFTQGNVSLCDFMRN